jgi:hypothetical protein
MMKNFNIHLIGMTVGKGSSHINPRLAFFADWLRPMGFVPNALVQFIPESEGARFFLCNENIDSYSKLFRHTKERGGALVHSRQYAHRDCTCLSISGASLRSTGLLYGDNLIATYDYGFVHVRKLPEANMKIVTPRIFGQWLVELGFVAEEVLTVGSEHGLITCTLQENGIARTYELVKYARENKLNLLQISAMTDNNGYPQFEIPPSRLNKAGFSENEPLFALYEYGRITLQHIDFKALGFNTIPANPILS